MFFRSMGPRGFRETNLFFVTRNADDTWTASVAINNKVERLGHFPNLTPDGKYMIYFEGGDYFWFDAEALMKELIKWTVVFYGFRRWRRVNFKIAEAPT